MNSFQLPEGYHLELVADETMLSEPVAIAWDGNARMYVPQMETYMQAVDTTGEQVPASRVKLLEDADDDGKMDKSSVFIDSLMLTRMILAVGDELLVNKTDVYDIYAYKDTNGDGMTNEYLRSLVICVMILDYLEEEFPGNLGEEFVIRILVKTEDVAKIREQSKDLTKP